jgi:acyl-CoA reductase-like NAD-dependent aldehyde dehydrogenase
LVCFTGSAAGGLAVQRAAADRIVNVGLELGGKDPAYVREDVDIAWAAEEIVDGAVFNSGQSCCSIERVYVAESIHDDFVAAIQNVLKGYRIGDPHDKETHLGPVISKKSKETIESHIQDALDKGATNATPDNATFAGLPSNGNFVVPTLLTNVNHSMTVMRDETFGPVIPVMKVKNDDEAVKLMNNSEFGLTASVWTKDTEKGYALCEQIEAGTVFVNRCDFPSPVCHTRGCNPREFQILRLANCCQQDLAWTGWKTSGKGATLSKFGFDQFVKLKSYHLKDYPK